MFDAERELERDLLALNKAIDTSKAKLAKAQQALRECQVACDAATRQRMHRAAQLDQIVSTQGRLLLDSAPDCINAFRDELDRMLTTTRAEQPAVIEDTTWSLRQGTQKVRRSNHDSIGVRIRAIVEARRQAEQLHLIADPAAIEVRIATIRELIPATDIFESYAAPPAADEPTPVLATI